MIKDFRLGDHSLWEEVRRTIKSLGAKKTRAAGDRKLAKPAAMRQQRLEPAGHQSLPTPQKMAHGVPPLQVLDRRTAQKLSRGQVEPEARLDLHGDSLETARLRLAHFVARERHNGAKFVLVITGKGTSPYARHTLHGFGHFHAPEREGRLRRELPHWLAEEQFRHHVVGFQPAHPRHGGGGAFYLRLRKRGG